MKLAMIGLGKMGFAMTQRLIDHGHEVVVYDLDAEALERAAKLGAIPANSLEQCVENLATKPRTVWLMVPAGEPVAVIIQDLALLLDEEDIILDGGNSNYQQSIERANMLRYKGIHLLDVGVSGGIWGLENGFNLMIGGEEEAFAQVEPVFVALAPVNGYQLIGPSGAGHFANMVHNGIEYGMMQAIAEGFELIAAKEEMDIDLAALARLWGNGSVIRSWLLELAGNVYEEDPNLDWVEPFVPDTGEGRWTVQESIDLGIPLPVITLALQMRFISQQDDNHAARLLAALRNQFGGHEVRRR
ncbi:MAG: decarboxylating 6-phosphogluconate dehydrogenase [Anaerolineae bacterium]|nr:decarboxylating 6-phosphogluconate dehydrogenase [Anaerolineae bacterium]